MTNAAAFTSAVPSRMPIGADRGEAFRHRERPEQHRAGMMRVLVPGEGTGRVLADRRRHPDQRRARRQHVVREGHDAASSLTGRQPRCACTPAATKSGATASTSIAKNQAGGRRRPSDEPPPITPGC